MHAQAMVAEEIRHDEARFYFKLAVAMAMVVVAGFSTNILMGRSSFGAPLRVHIHAVVFMGWVALYVLQNWLVARGNIGVHRRLGWIALPWVLAMLLFGLIASDAMVRAGNVPFFFIPQHFMIADPATLLCFAALTAAAIALRGRSDWHRRLHLCAMAALMGPAFGRLIPMPLLVPFAFETAAMLGLLFPLIAMHRDLRLGAFHPAWAWGLPALPATLIFAAVVGHSPLATEIYVALTSETAGARVDPLAHGVPPPGM